jgi:hypothetical protein
VDDSWGRQFLYSSKIVHELNPPHEHEPQGTQKKKVICSSEALVSNFGKYVESVTINNALFALSPLVVVLADARLATLLALGSMVHVQ